MRAPLAAASVVLCAALATPAAAQIDTPKQAVMILADGKAAYGEVGSLTKAGVAFKPDGWKTGTVQPWALVRRIHTQVADYTPEPAKLCFQRANADPKPFRLVGAKPGGVVLDDGTVVQGRVLVLTPAGVAIQKADTPIGQWHDARAVKRVEVDGDKYDRGPVSGALEKVESPPPPVAAPPVAALLPKPAPPTTVVEDSSTVPAPPKSDPKPVLKAEPPKPAAPPVKAEAATPAKAADNDAARWLWRLLPTGTIFALVCFVLKWSIRLLIAVAVGAVMFGIVGAVVGGLVNGTTGASVGWGVGSVFGVIGAVGATWEQMKEELAAGTGPAHHSGPDLPYPGDD